MKKVIVALLSATTLAFANPQDVLNSPEFKKMKVERINCYKQLYKLIKLANRYEPAKKYMSSLWI